MMHASSLRAGFLPLFQHGQMDFGNFLKRTPHEKKSSIYACLVGGIQIVPFPPEEFSPYWRGGSGQVEIDLVRRIQSVCLVSLVRIQTRDPYISSGFYQGKVIGS
jgi:hypothetical protein